MISVVSFLKIPEALEIVFHNSSRLTCYFVSTTQSSGSKIRVSFMGGIG